MTIKPSCERCGSTVHRDDAMNARCDGCEHLVRQYICTPLEGSHGKHAL